MPLYIEGRTLSEEDLFRRRTMRVKALDGKHAVLISLTTFSSSSDRENDWLSNVQWSLIWLSLFRKSKLKDSLNIVKWNTDDSTVPNSERQPTKLNYFTLLDMSWRTEDGWRWVIHANPHAHNWGRIWCHCALRAPWILLDSFSRAVVDAWALLNMKRWRRLAREGYMFIRPGSQSVPFMRERCLRSLSLCPCSLDLQFHQTPHLTHSMTLHTPFSFSVKCRHVGHSRNSPFWIIFLNAKFQESKKNSASSSNGAVGSYPHPAHPQSLSRSFDWHDKCSTELALFAASPIEGSHPVGNGCTRWNSGLAITSSACKLW